MSSTVTEVSQEWLTCEGPWDSGPVQQIVCWTARDCRGEVKEHKTITAE